MNLVGKILVVAVFVLSLVFMSFTVAVHSTHTNWRDMVERKEASEGKPLGLEHQLKDRDSRITQLQTELTEKQRILDREIREYQQRLGQLESARAEAETARLKAQEQNGQLLTDLQAATEASKAATDVLTSIRGENDKLREQNKDLKKQRDDSLGTVVKLQDELAQALGEWTRVGNRNKQLLAQLAQYHAVIQDRNLPLNLDKPTVVGKVQATVTNKGLVEINLGKDDGLKQGDTLDVYRVGATLAKTQYLGRIQLTRVEKSVAVGLEDPKYKRGTIQRDDHVATRLTGIQ